MTDVKNFLKSKKENKNPLIAIHNITEYKLYQLLFDLNLEGIPTPSIQIKPFINKQADIKNIEDNSSLERFGEISFVFDQENLFGEHKTIPVNNQSYFIYEGDAYTSRMPSIRYSKNVKEFNRVYKELIKLDLKGERALDDSVIQLFNKSYLDKEHFRQEMLKSELIKKWFMDEYGRVGDYKVFKKKVVLDDRDLGLLNSEYIKDTFKKIKKEEDFDKYKDELVAGFKKHIDNVTSSFMLRRYKRKYLDKSGDVSFELIKSAHLKDINKPEVITRVDFDRTKNRTNRIVKEIEKENGIRFIDFINHKLDDILISPKISETNKPVDLESLYKWLRNNKGEGVEQGSFAQFEKLAAKFQKRIRSVSEMYEHIPNLIDNATYESRKREYDQLKSSIYNSFSSIDSHSYDEVDDIFFESIRKAGRSAEKEKIKEVFISEGINLNDELIDKIAKFAYMNNNRGYQYMEAKIQNTFYFKESNYRVLDNQLIRGVVVPNNIDEKITSMLKEYGMKVETYNPNKKGDRYRALLNFKDFFIKNPEFENSPKRKPAKRKISKT